MIKMIKVKINGKVREIAADERSSLTDLLRDGFGLRSVKKGCEAGECGACAVLFDGRTLNSCIFPAVMADGHEILTVEGLNEEGVLHPVQQAFVDLAAVQCGFCTPGLILCGVELVNTGRKYTRAEIQKHISGHLCRCTGYVNIVEAIYKIAGADEI